MLKNHLHLAIRNLFKRKGYSLLNILGLAIGITCCLLIFQHVAHERSYERFNPNAGQVYRLRLDAWQQGKLAWQSATVYPAIAPAMKQEFPEVENFCRLIDANFLLSNDANRVKIRETKGYFADPSALNILGINLVKGNPASALDGPNKIILSESMARKYFGSEDPIGKRLIARDQNNVSLEVTGIYKDYPANSHLILHHLISYATLNEQIRQGGDSTRPAETSWGWYDFYAYVKLKPGTDWQALQAKLPAFADRHMNNREWMKKNNNKNTLFLTPLTDIHLYSNYNQEAEVNGNGKAVGFLFLIAFLIVVIAWVNYTNLATSRSLERAREVGVRKVLGAVRGDLVLQFLTESLLLNTLSLLIALLAAILLARPFNDLVGSSVAAPFSLPLNYSLGFAALFLAGTFLSGAYPAFVLSGYQPIKVLKGMFKNSSQGQVLRKTLIIGQFAVSVILIAGTILVYQQVQFMRSQQLGVNIHQTLVLEGASAQQDSVYRTAFQPFKTELLQQTDIQSVTASSNVMGQEIYWTNTVQRLDGEAKASVTLYHLGIDYDFLPAYDLKLAAGRNFSKDFPTDRKAILVNQRASDLLGFKNVADAIGKKLRRGGDTATIIGVIADYHHQGLQKAIDPMVILLTPNQRSFYSIKITSHPQQTIASIEKTWNKYFPNDPFNYFFLDESFGQQYKADIRFGQVFGLFATLAILIACFGLLGLSAYNVLQRTREIGIRKVLGASVQSLVFTLSKEFVYLVLISLVIAVPLTWWVMHNWLQDFAYRISIEWWVFVFAGILAILIALVTVGFQALRAALTSPVKSLRTE
ncbi:MAG: ABC transporter permease [Chitinophagaceae bacterium]|nr:ABC transporter permease [Chitinophagaceae bacterium]